LWALDRLAAAPPPPDPKLRCRVLYISPLKALAGDIERNLRAPLTGIRQMARRMGIDEPDISVAVRTGDTAADERRRLAAKPPDILITTPESLFLLLTSRARDALRGVDTVILDEVHALAGTKRGAHLALSLERLDALRMAPGNGTPGETQRPAGPVQRIGLSATVRPPGEVASFLGGARPVTIAAPPSSKQIEVRIVVPVEDMADIDPLPAQGGGSPDVTPAQRSIWPHVEERVLDLIEQHRSTIVFANSRRLAERLCGRLNELAGERAEARAAIPAASGYSTGPPPPARPRRWPGPTTVRYRGRSGPRSRRRSRRAGCLPWSPRPAWNWASTWAPWTLSSRSSPRPQWPAGCSASGARGTTWATCRVVLSSRSTRETWSRRPWSPGACTAARSRNCTSPAIRSTCSPSRSSR